MVLPLQDYQRLSKKVDDMYNALYACIQNHCVSKEELHPIMDIKVNREDFEGLLLQKANKQSVATALQRKANKNDISAIEERLSLLAA
jgi:hypothetical protein